MAATAKPFLYVSGQGGPAVVTKVELSTLVSGELVAVTHGGPSGVAPREVSLLVKTRPTAPGGVCMSWESDDTSANTSSVRLVHSDGASALTGAVVQVVFKFYDSASGGIS